MDLRIASSPLPSAAYSDSRISSVVFVWLSIRNASRSITAEKFEITTFAVGIV